jgi:hypothetical protein
MNPVKATQPKPPTRRALLQDVQLMAQDEEFGFQLLWRLETIPQCSEIQETDCNHSVMMF